MDKVWCGVFTMDACYLLLGRPWQYDRAIVHDGRKNTFNFMFDNMKIMLIPSQVMESKPSRGMVNVS